jgi:hypothetical protein
MRATLVEVTLFQRRAGAPKHDAPHVGHNIAVRSGGSRLNAVLPVRWPTPMMRDRKHEDVVRENPVDQVVREATHSKLADLPPALRADAWILAQSPERGFNLDDEAITKPRNSPAQERPSLGKVILRFGKKADFRHSVRRRLRTRSSASAAGLAVVSPVT